MAEFSDIYIDGVRKKYHDYYVAWIPTKDLRLGDFGIVNKNIFDSKGNVNQFGVNYKVQKDRTPGTLMHASSSEIVFKTKLGGQVNRKIFPHIPKGEAGIKYEFGSKNSFVLAASNTRENKIVNKVQLAKDIENLYNNGKGEWNKDWYVITDLVEVSCFRLIISKNSGSEIELSAESDIEIKDINLADAEINFSVKFTKGDIFQQFLNDATPLFRLHKLEKHILGFVVNEKFPMQSMQERNLDYLHSDDLEFSGTEYLSLDMAIPEEMDLQ